MSTTIERTSRVSDHGISLIATAQAGLRRLGAGVFTVRSQLSPTPGPAALIRPLDEAARGGATMLLVIGLDAKESTLTVRRGRFPTALPVAGGGVQSECSRWGYESEGTLLIPAPSPGPSSVSSIGGERGSCRLSNAAPVGSPRPRNAGRHRADRYSFYRPPPGTSARASPTLERCSRPPPRSGKFRRRSSPASEGRARASAGSLVRTGRAAAVGAAEGLSRRAARSGCSRACPPHAVVTTAGTAKGAPRAVGTASGVQLDELSWPVNPFDFSKLPI